LTPTHTGTSSCTRRNTGDPDDCIVVPSIVWADTAVPTGSPVVDDT
jgi:hypothetical protein